MRGHKMSTGTACWIFGNINQGPYTDEEKLEAIRIVAEMETHNAIKKAEMVAVMRWLLEYVN
ncbi:hypothetical protein [Hungatella effluvii]|uniref:hypothetical protein n=1 Tax=Hungatella effluvii TaxID=1096246 RepID=UPI002A7FA1F8|nr:hypothetical protein [Hungatella effluvii]